MEGFLRVELTEQSHPSQIGIKIKGLEKPLAVSCYVALKMASINMGVFCYHMAQNIKKMDTNFASCV